MLLFLFHSFVISLAPIEQAFSTMGLLKTETRNRLSLNSLEALMMIHDAFRGKDIIITQKMIELFDQVKSDLNGKKVRVRSESE